MDGEKTVKLMKTSHMLGCQNVNFCQHNSPLGNMFSIRCYICNWKGGRVFLSSPAFASFAAQTDWSVMMERFQVDWKRLKKLNLKLINLDNFIMTWDITFFEIQIRTFPNPAQMERMSYWNLHYWPKSATLLHSTLFPIVHFMSVFKLIERFTNELTLLKGCQDGRSCLFFVSSPDSEGWGRRREVGGNWPSFITPGWSVTMVRWQDLRRTSRILSSPGGHFDHQWPGLN